MTVVEGWGVFMFTGYMYISTTYERRGITQTTLCLDSYATMGKILSVLPELTRAVVDMVGVWGGFCCEL